MTYAGYTNTAGLVHLFVEFSAALDKVVGEEDIDNDRLGVGHFYTGYENGEFVK